MRVGEGGERGEDLLNVQYKYVHLRTMAHMFALKDALDRICNTHIQSGFCVCMNNLRKCT
jgi:hypothetical protein